MDGNLTYSEVMGWTNVQRGTWILRLNKRDKQRNDAMEAAKRKK